MRWDSLPPSRVLPRHTSSTCTSPRSHSPGCAGTCPPRLRRLLLLPRPHPHPPLPFWPARRGHWPPWGCCPRTPARSHTAPFAWSRLSLCPVGWGGGKGGRVMRRRGCDDDRERGGGRATDAEANQPSHTPDRAAHFPRPHGKKGRVALGAWGESLRSSVVAEGPRNTHALAKVFFSTPGPPNPPTHSHPPPTPQGPARAPPRPLPCPCLPALFPPPSSHPALLPLSPPPLFPFPPFPSPFTKPWRTWPPAS